MLNSAKIILNWLNRDLNIRPKIKDIKTSFSNGYLFGKVFALLKLITKEEFEEFSDSDKEVDINLNFSLVSKYCKKFFNLIIFENEINEIKNKDITKAAVLLYKIRNNDYKLKINFNNISFFGSNFSKDEISEQINDLIQRQLGDNEDDEKSISENPLGKNINKDINITTEHIKEISEENNENEINNIKNNFNPIDNKSMKLNKFLPSISATKGLNKFSFKKINYESVFRNKENNNKKLFIKSKTILSPINYIVLKKKSNSTENIFKKEIKFDDIFSSKKDYNSQLIDVTYFNKKLEDLGINKKDFQINEIRIKNSTNINSFNNALLSKNKNNEIIYNKKTNTTPGMINYGINMKSAEEIGNELKKKLRPQNLEVEKELLIKKNENKEINFRKIGKNLLNKNQMNFNFKNQISLSHLRRINYSKDLSMKNKKIMQLNSELSFISSNQSLLPNVFSTRNIDNINSINKINKFSTMNQESTKEFNEKLFFQDLSNQTLSSFKFQCEKKYLKKRRVSKGIKDIVLYIIDMTMEGYIYQKEHKSEIMDLDTFLKFNIYFLKKKRLRKKYIPVEEVHYKRSGKIEQKIDKEMIINNLTNEAKNYIEDYIYYLGIWNDDIIYDQILRGIRLEYKYITNKQNNKENKNNFGTLIEYEPTALESEDLTLPNSVPDNHNLGELLLEIFSLQFNNEILNNNNNINQNFLNGKWDYIPYKISLIGYPLSGRKTLAKKISETYPNMKIYIMRRIINYYFEIYLQLADPIDIPEEKQTKKKPKKNEAKKENEEEDSETNIKITDKEKESIFERHERHQKLKEMKPIFDALKPYIDYKLNMNNINEKNKKKNELCILPDESLCLLLVKKIEEDFPLLTQQKITKIFMDRQANLKELKNQIEIYKKKKEEPKKQNINYDTQIEKIEHEIKYIKMKSISGFILIDFPSNLNQCLLLENYLTGYIDEKRQKKSEKDKIISNTDLIIDYKYQPKEKNNLDKKTGLNFIINITTKENIINERFNTAKYDPIEKILYTGKNIKIEDKNIKERIINRIPYLSKELFEYNKDEYDNNVNKIINFYSEFGFLIKSKKNHFDFIEPKKDEKFIKAFYSFESEDIKDFYFFNNKKPKNKKTTKKEKDKDKEGELNQEEIIDENTINKSKIFNFICNNLIEKLYEKNDKYEEEQYNIEIAKNNNKLLQRKSSVNFQPDLNIDEIKTKYKNKSSKKGNGNSKLIDYDKNKIDIILKEISEMNNKYYENIAIFIYLMNSQKKYIYDRLNLTQSSFRDFLNLKAPGKQKVISNYIKKYNSFYNTNPALLNNELVIKELNSDIEVIRMEIWEIISLKREDSIQELNEIKYCSFIEVELIKFYNNIKDLILNETEKFLTIFNNMFILFNKIKDKENRDITILINEFKKKLIINPTIIFKNTKEYKCHFTAKGDVKLDMSLDELVELILENIELIFKNCIKMLFSYHYQLTSIFRRIKKSIFVNASVIKKSFRFRKKKRKNSEKKLFSVSMMNDLLTNKGSDAGYLQEKSIKKLFLDEKNKFKFRICFIKNFAEKYIQIMKCTAENVFDRMDEWIVKNVTLQSESLSYLLKIFKNFLFHEKKLIDKESDIDYIELDEFEKVIEEGNNGNKKINNSSKISTIGSKSGIIRSTENDIKLRPFDNSSVINTRIYNRINLDYLVNDNFIETKIEEIYDLENIKKQLKPKIKIIPPHSIYNANNSENNFANNSSSEIKGEKSLILNLNLKNDKNKKDKEFYFDLEKFKFLYKLIKKYEVEDGYIKKEIFFEIFVRQYLIYKKKYEKKKGNNSEDSEESENVNMNININDFYNEGINVDIDTKQNLLNNINSPYPVICDALKKLNMKQIKRMYYCFGANFEKLKYINLILIENKKEKEKNEIKENDNINNINIGERNAQGKTTKKTTTSRQVNDLKLISSKSKEKTENKSTQEESKKIDNNTLDKDNKENKENKEINEYNTY